MLHENHPLTPALRKRINARKKDYVHFVENLIAEVQNVRGGSKLWGSKENRHSARRRLCTDGNAELDLSVVPPRRLLAGGEPGPAVHRDIFSGGVRVSEVFALDELLAKRLQAGRSYLEFLRVPAMSAGVYVLPTGAHDPQQPHHQDEIYYVVRGKAKMRLGDERAEERFVGEGSIIFVEAGLEHRFFDVEEELVLLVVFAPEES